MDSLRKIQVKFDKVYEQLVKRPQEDSLLIEVNGLETLIHDELTRLTGSITEIPLCAVTDLDPYLIRPIFRLTQDEPRRWEFEPGSKENISPPAAYLTTLLSDYELALGSSESNGAISSTRIDAIILTTLAQVKKNAAANPTLSISSKRSTLSLRIQYQTKLSMQWKLPMGPHMLSGRMDWSVWYESPDGCLETNFILVKAKHPLESAKAMQQCLTYMAMVYWARKKAGLKQTDVWGIATSSSICSFLHIRSDGTYATEPYSWTNSSGIIPAMVSKMYCCAAKAGELPTQNKRWTTASGARFETVSEYEQSTNSEQDI